MIKKLTNILKPTQLYANNFRKIKKITKEASFELKYLDATTTWLYGLPKLHKRKHSSITNSFFTDSPTCG